MIYFGRDKKNLYSQAEKEFYNRIKRYTKFDIIGLDPPKISSTTPRQVIQQKEEDILETKVDSKFYKILLDEKGKQFTSKQFAKYIDVKRAQHADISFLIGGAYGFSEKMRQKNKEIISLSPLTFPHHLARLLFLEQLYRAFTINNNEPYHNE